MSHSLLFFFSKTLIENMAFPLYNKAISELYYDRENSLPKMSKYLNLENHVRFHDIKTARGINQLILKTDYLGKLYVITRVLKMWKTLAEESKQERQLCEKTLEAKLLSMKTEGRALSQEM